jgi:hypothetical protein
MWRCGYKVGRDDDAKVLRVSQAHLCQLPQSIRELPALIVENLLLFLQALPRTRQLGARRLPRFIL